MFQVSQNKQTYNQSHILLLPLKKNQENEIIFHAENLGSEPPNTAAVQLEYDNGIKKDFTMRSNFDANGIIRILQKEE